MDSLLNELVQPYYEGMSPRERINDSSFKPSTGSSSSRLRFAKLTGNNFVWSPKRCDVGPVEVSVMSKASTLGGLGVPSEIHVMRFFQDITTGVLGFGLVGKE